MKKLGIGAFMWMFTILPIFSTEPSAYVLCYHTFLGKPSIETDFSSKEFQSHIQILQSHGIRFVTFEDILCHRIRGKKNVLLVIDDGNISTKKVYETILKPAKIYPMLAIYPGIIDSRKFALKWNDLISMQEDGCTIASHGYFHQYLTTTYAHYHPKEFEDEFFKSKQLLERHLRHVVPYFVYPFGITSNIAIQRIKKSGYRYAFTIKPTPISLSTLTKSPLLLPRFMVTRRNYQHILTRITKDS